MYTIYCRIVAAMTERYRLGCTLWSHVCFEEHCEPWEGILSIPCMSVTFNTMPWMYSLRQRMDEGLGFRKYFDGFIEGFNCMNLHFKSGTLNQLSDSFPIRKLEQLKSLSVHLHSSAETFNFIHGMPNIATINLEDVEPNNIVLFRQLKYLQNLDKLKIVQNFRPISIRCIDAINSLTQLKQLELKASWKEVLVIPSGLIYLEKLKITGWWNKNDNMSGQRIAVQKNSRTPFPNLSSVHLNCVILDGHTFSILLSGKRLKELELNDATIDMPFADLKNCTLERVTLNDIISSTSNDNCVFSIGRAEFFLPKCCTDAYVNNVSINTYLCPTCRVTYGSTHTVEYQSYTIYDPSASRNNERPDNENDDIIVIDDDEIMIIDD